MGKMVIACYRPKPGQEAALLAVVKEHLPILRGLGLATERPSLAMRAADGTVVEVFEWVSDEAVEKAHHDPTVRAMWDRFAGCAEMVKYGSLAEAGETFPHFTPVDV